MSARHLDLRGMRCPWPALRVARALRDAGGDVVVLADDPRAPDEIGAVAAARGWTIEPLRSDDAMTWRLTRSPMAGNRNRPFTPPLA